MRSNYTNLQRTLKAVVSPFSREAQFWTPSANSISQHALSYTRQIVSLMEDCYREVNIKLIFSVWIASLSFFLTHHISS